MRRALSDADPRIFGSYRPTGVLDEGGMAILYICVDEMTQELCAVKTIKSEWRFDQSSVERFKEEARTHARLKSRFIVSVLASDTESDPPWIALEYLNHHNIATTVEVSGHMVELRLMDLAHDLTQGLMVVHGAGVIHRDIKPDNIVLTRECAKLLDFGIARSNESLGLTRDHSFLGSRIWASPEQLKREPVTPQTDIFSLGQVLAFVGTGRPPFGDATTEAELSVVTRNILTAPPDLDGLSKPIRDVLLAALEKDATSRPSLEELHSAFAAMRDGSPDVAPATVHSATTWHSFVDEFDAKLEDRRNDETEQALSLIRESWRTRASDAVQSTVSLPETSRL